jgi:hypothetical protein
MSRILGAAIVATALIATPAAAKTPKPCKHLHGHAKKTCVRKHVKPKPKRLAVTTTLLDGSTITTSAGAFGIAGSIEGFIPSKVQLNTPTVVTETRGSLTATGCGGISLGSSSPYGPALGVMVLNAEGTALAALHLTLPDCGGDTTLLLGGTATQPDGLNALVLDSVPGPVTAHLVVKVDLSGR